MSSKPLLGGAAEDVELGLLESGGSSSGLLLPRVAELAVEEGSEAGSGSLRGSVAELVASPSVATMPPTPRPDEPRVEEEGLGGMERRLLSLLAAFRQGKVRAFASEGTMREMEGVRAGQEALAQLHFSLHHRLALLPQGPQRHHLAAEHSRLIIQRLQNLDQSIQRLSWTDSDLPKGSDAFQQP